MAILFMIPGALRELTANRAEVAIDAAAGPLSAALAGLWREHPGIRDRLVTELGRVRPHVNIFVDGQDIRYSGGLDTPVRDGAEVFIVPAVSGGSEG